VLVLRSAASTAGFNNITLVTVPLGPKTGMLPESIEKERAIGKLQRDNFRRAVLAGTRMAFGPDAGVYPHGDNWKQFPYMVGKRDRILVSWPLSSGPV
jgi:hypothetical protein